MAPKSAKLMEQLLVAWMATWRVAVLVGMWAYGLVTTKDFLMVENWELAMESLTEVNLVPYLGTIWVGVLVDRTAMSLVDAMVDSKEPVGAEKLVEIMALQLAIH